jgi:DNA-directed RNA polymerase subunit RPC12/RpoP
VGRAEENTGFRCVGCGAEVIALSNGSYRNHCPFCLTSLHVDEDPGDRVSDCAGLMDAIAVIRTKKGWQLVHRCRRCGARRVNRVAFETRQPDDLDAVIALM